MNIEVGDTVKMKKQHPCGNNVFEIIRTGIDFKIRCLKCEHIAMISRVKLEKKIKELIKNKI